MFPGVSRQPEADLVELAFGLAGAVRREFHNQMSTEAWAHDANLRRGCFGVLRAIAESDEPVSQRDVAARTMIDPSDVVDLVDRLEAAHLLKRVRDPDDRRRYTLVLTPEGRRAIKRFGRVAEAVDEAVLEPLTPRQRNELRRLLRRVVGGHNSSGAPHEHPR
jgi:MarR family transcriptional regulator, lower aerobic nicotinate degradation pathway regulator